MQADDASFAALLLLMGTLPSNMGGHGDLTTENDESPSMNILSTM
jgi:hypothetical protein